MRRLARLFTARWRNRAWRLDSHGVVTDRIGRFTIYLDILVHRSQVSWWPLSHLPWYQASAFGVALRDYAAALDNFWLTALIRFVGLPFCQSSELRSRARV